MFAECLLEARLSVCSKRGWLLFYSIKENWCTGAQTRAQGRLWGYLGHPKNKLWAIMVDKHWLGAHRLGY